jgi:3-hydroxymyristoyl/3-hydroxydecanoyl-(acyl carrier protein) dehydratase
MQWYSMMNLRQSNADEITADIRIPPDSPWFNGHFPGEPILPGVAQLGIVFDMISRARNQKLTISSVRRIRFKQIIRPHDRLSAIAIPLQEDTESYSFRIFMEGEPVCGGVMTVAERMNSKR